MSYATQACLALSLLAASVPAQSQMRSIEAVADVPWRHAASGTTFPAVLQSLQRYGTRDTGSKELDIIAGYKSPDGRDELTV